MLKSYFDFMHSFYNFVTVSDGGDREKREGGLDPERLFESHQNHYDIDFIR